MRELIIDNFAGGGGASLGIEMALGRGPDIAVNHDPQAVAMHAANHPDTLHLCQDVWDVDPVEVCAGRPVGLAWFSPDCTHFSRAKGGKPVDRKRRCLADIVIKWARAVRPAVIALENVSEFMEWGGLLPDGRPDPAQKGLEFRRWMADLRACGYEVELRELTACDYGAPTSRKRLFVIARCDGRPIVWPTPTHGKGRQPYRTAAQCIDWTLPCPSIFDRLRPLAENTLKRIARGIRRYVLGSPEPFVVKNMTNNVARGVSEPLSTILTGGHHLLVNPVVMAIDHKSNPAAVWPSDRPLTTITTEARHALVVPSLIQAGYGEREGQAPRTLDIEKPLGTIVAGGRKHALVAAFLAKHFGGHESPGTQLSLPLSTITTQDHHALVAVPLAVDAQDRRAEVRAFLIKYYGTDQDPQLHLPLHTITTVDRFGLVTVEGVDYEIADIGMRMLCPRELFRAQGFPDTYQIEIDVNGRRLSKSAQVRMCGNSVSPPVAAAIVRANVAAVREQVA